MGIWQSSHEFVEPLAYDFERVEAVSAVTAKIIVIEEEITQPCPSCIKRWERKVRIRENAVKAHREAEVNGAYSIFQQKVAGKDVITATENLELVSKKHAASTADRDKAPVYIRRQLKEAHRYLRQAIINEEYASVRVDRKMRAVANLRHHVRESANRETAALKRKEDCTLRIFKGPTVL